MINVGDLDERILSAILKIEQCGDTAWKSVIRVSVEVPGLDRDTKWELIDRRLAFLVTNKRLKTQPYTVGGRQVETSYKLLTILDSLADI